MSRRTNRRNRNTIKDDITSISFHQLERKKLRNRFSPVEPLEEEQVELIHNTSLRLLEEQGIEVLREQALELFRRAGANIDSNGVVQMDRDLVMETISTAPAEFTVTPRNLENAIHCGGDVINFGLVSGPPNVHDCIQGRRPENIADYRKIIRFGQHFNVLTFFGNQAIAPTDLPVNSRHMDTTLANPTLADKVFFVTGIGAGRSTYKNQLTFHR